ncbi:MAG: hypothetical protein SGBAC_011776 [Bacillariaceae sp.]
MKLSSTLTTLALFVSGAQAAQVKCLDEGRYNLESMCRNECSKLDSAAFAVSYAEDDDSCRCFPKMEGRKYTGNVDPESRFTCYSMTNPKMRVLEYGDCIFGDGSAPDSTTHLTLERCPIQDLKAQKEANCLDGMRYNLEKVCRNECAKHDDIVAFSVSYDEEDDSCHCYPNIPGVARTYTGTGNVDSRLTCYSMVGKTKVNGYGDCMIDGVVGEYSKKYTMTRCPANGDRLRRRVLA